ncbi:MAG: twin-arginine translocation signal domain-containing protein [Candidatus Hydrothermarchaeaceae archaeon]
MMTRREFLKALACGGATIAFFPPAAVHGERGEVKEFHVKLTRIKFTPAVITVNQGDIVRLSLEGMDVEHGYYIDGYDIDERVRHAELKVLEFVADKPGAFRIRCSVPCSPTHPFITGKLVVKPNHRFSASIGLALVLPFATLMYLHLRRKAGKNGD